MAINKVIVNGETKIDLTEDTVTADKVVKGLTFHDATGELKTGTFEGTDGNLPFYFYELDNSKITDDFGYMDNAQFDLVIDNVQSNYGDICIYIDDGHGGVEMAEYYDSIKFTNVAPGLRCIFISTQPVTSVSAHAEGAAGY